MNNSASFGSPKYAGFWIRFLAYLIDGVVLGIVGAILSIIFGSSQFDMKYNYSDMELFRIISNYLYSFIITSLFSLFYYIIMNVQLGGTVGKLLTNIEIRKYPTFERIDFGTAFGRYFSKILSAIPFSLGYIWAGFDQKKQAWHDKLANTVVIYPDSLSSNELPSDEKEEFFESPAPRPTTLPMRGKPFADIVFVRGVNKGKKYTLKGERVIFGRRASDVHIQIKDPEKFVSKIQCEIVKKNNRYYLRNLSSQDSTKLNGTVVSSPQPLRTEDVISFGHFSFKILFF